jgi:hypothetical protein
MGVSFRRIDGGGGKSGDGVRKRREAGYKILRMLKPCLVPLLSNWK